MSKIAIIDADSLLYFEMGKDTLEEAIEGIDNRIQEILEKTESDSYVGYLTIGKCFRYEVAKSKPYKYNRPGGLKPPIFYALKTYLQQNPHNFKYVKGLEADDMVSIARTYFIEQGHECVISSPDKDVLKQIPGKHYNYQKAEFYETSKKEADAFLWKQVLMGDSTDGIPGIPGLGPKTADKLIDSSDGKNYLHITVDKYLEKFELQQGIYKFGETFNLVYIIRNLGEIPDPYKIPEQEYEHVFNLNVIEDARIDSEADDWDFV